MIVAVDRPVEDQLLELAAVINAHPDWWQFPGQNAVRGFLGADPILIVGDQPSTSPWDESHPNRRVFYGLLAKIGAGNVHITDLYKRRGRSGALRKGLPADFQEHLAFFRREVTILHPTRVVALGHHAFQLLHEHVPELRPILRRMWHFAYVVRYGKVAEYEANMRSAIFGA